MTFTQTLLLETYPLQIHEFSKMLAKITIRLHLRKNIHSKTIKIPLNRLAVSGMACKELTSCHSILTSKELGEIKAT